MTYQSSYFSQMYRHRDRQKYIVEYVQVEHVKIIQDNWSRRLPLRHKNVASTGAPLKHIMGNELNIIQFILTYISTSSSSSSLGSRCVPWLGEGLSMPSPNYPVLCFPLPYRVARGQYLSRSSRHRLAGLPCRLFLS